MRAYRLIPVLGLAGFASAAIGFGCVSTECEFTATCPPSSSGGLDATDGPPTPPGCDPNADPKDAEKCVVSSFGVFVSPSGSAAGDGSKEAPVNTVSLALTKLNGKQRIYVCEGAYSDRIEIRTLVNIFGGFACNDWHYTGTKPIIKSDKPAATLDIESGASITISDLEIVGGPTTNTEPHAIAARARLSGRVTVRRTTIRATAGFDFTAASATNGVPGVISATNVAGDLTPTGRPGSGSGAGDKKTCTCTIGGETQGSGGGGGGTNGAAGSPGLPAIPENPIGSGRDGAGGTAGGAASQCGAGHFGAHAKKADDAPTPTKFGTINNGVWTAASGGDGMAGSVGQGGGGGGGREGGGGGGGCGGCGGGGGKGGVGGGASIGLLAIDTTIALIDSSITATGGGGGGRGGTGSNGTNGGTGQAGGSNPTTGCPGGDGGNGGTGGAGAGGPGGVSFGILFSGQPPELDAMSRVSGGTGGGGGAGGSAANAGPKGLSQPTMNVAELP